MPGNQESVGDKEVATDANIAGQMLKTFRQHQQKCKRFVFLYAYPLF
jgi:hypothetical protein